MTRLNNRNKRLLQNHDTLIRWVQNLLNTICVVVVLIGITFWRDGSVGDQYRAMCVFAVLVMMITYHIFGVHRRLDNLLGGIQHLARAWGVVIIILAWVAFLTKTSEKYSRQIIVYWAVLAFLLQATIQIFLVKAYSIYTRKFRERVPTIVIGTGISARHLAKSLANNIWLRDEVIGVLSLEGDDVSTWTSDDVQILGDVKSLIPVIEKHKIRRVYLAPKFEQTAEIKVLQEELIDSNIDLVWVPDIFQFRLLNHSVREVAGVPLITLNETPLMSGGQAFIKMVMDKTVSFLVILILSPVIVATALAVKLSSKGPIIFKQVRDGWDGRKFYVYKFRSMYVHQPDKVVKQASKGDPRITPVGAFIRKTSLDELPQLFNILEGSMSLVGPRPHAESHNVFYSDKVKAYLARHRIKPGMTGLAQINGLRGETETVEAMERRVELDLEYISNWSPLLDIKILFLTPFALIAKKGNAY